VVELGEEIVALLTIGAARDSDLDLSRTAEIWGIYISPKYWRRRIGTTLVEEAEGIFKSRGFKNAVLWVLEGNQQARRFYEAMGFALDGESKTIDWGAPLKAVRYRKALQPVEQEPAPGASTGCDAPGPGWLPKPLLARNSSAE